MVIDGARPGAASFLNPNIPLKTLIRLAQDTTAD